MSTEEIAEVVARLRTRKSQVRYLLEKYPNARNNDFYLQILWLKTFGGLRLPWIEYGEIKRLSGKMEGCRRVRQKIQNEDKEFLPTDLEVSRKRYRLSLAFRKAVHEV